MTISTVRCPVSQMHVSRVTDLEANVSGVICPEYDERTGVCRLKKSASDGGPLSLLLNRVAEETLDRRTIRCDLC